MKFNFTPYEEFNHELFLQATNGRWMGSLRLYVSKAELMELGDNLKKFDGTTKTKIDFEIGKVEKKYAYSLKLIVKPTDSLGHSKIHIEMWENNTKSTAIFSIDSVPASINRLGENLIHAVLTIESFTWEP
ncbi:MAG: hypothetical protein JXR70_18095 [Spirochaetales bacterium]|nr:hypothetical protein [Spirochaetales bacterium]